MTDFIKYLTNSNFIGAYNANKEGNKDAAEKGLVYIEDDSDQVFWEKFINFYFPNQYNIQASIKDRPGVRGKRALEELYSDANEKVLIAVDSDYDLICPDLNPQYSKFVRNNKFILSTFGFSRESALLNKNYLIHFFNSIKYTISHNINIGSFLEKLSLLIFKGLVFFSNELNSGNQFGFIESEFHNCFNILDQKIVKDDLSLDEDVLEIIKNNIDNYFSKLNYSEKVHRAAEDYLINLGVNSDNAYRFICGHTIYNLIHKIHEQLTNALFNLEVKKIAHTFHGKAISQRKEQLKQQFYSQSSLLAYCHCYPIKEDDEIHQRIKQKVAGIS